MANSYYTKDHWTLHTNVYGRKAATIIKAAIAHASVPLLTLNINKRYNNVDDLRTVMSTNGVPKDIKAVRMSDEEVVVGNWWDSYYWVKNYAITKVYLRKQIKNMIEWLDTGTWSYEPDDPFYIASAQANDRDGNDVSIPSFFKDGKSYTGRELIEKHAYYAKNDYHSTNFYPYELDKVSDEDFITTNDMRKVLADLLHPTYEGRNEDPMRQIWVKTINHQFIDGWPYHHRDDRDMWNELSDSKNGYIVYRLFIEMRGSDERRILMQPPEKIAEVYLEAIDKLAQKLNGGEANFGYYKECYNAVKKFVDGPKFKGMVEAVREMKSHPDIFMEPYRLRNLDGIDELFG